MTIGQTTLKTKAALAAAALLALPTPARAEPGDTYYERAFVVAADARCNLFAPHIDAALQAATAQAEVLLKSVLRAGNANNDINPIKSIGLLDEGAAVLSRLTNASAWWVQTDAPEGMKLLMRRKLEKTMEGDFETDSMRYKATERYDVGFTDWRAMYGTPGV